MTERPILFSAPMVRALLAGTKTQTRRVMKDQPPHQPEVWQGSLNRAMTQPVMAAAWDADDGSHQCLCPYGVPGDRLWVREAWMPVAHDTQPYRYRATNPSYAGKWRPSIHMPRVASRITLEIVSVHVEQLQGISDADAEAEGIETVSVSETDVRYVNYLRADRAQYPKEATCGRAVHSYATLWESINGPCSWASNPWVWVVEFKRVTQ